MSVHPIADSEGQILNLIEVLGELEWRKYQSRYPNAWINRRYEKVDSSGRPPFVSFRFKNEDELTVDRIRQSVDDYDGRVKWVMVGHKRIGLPGTNWMICPSDLWVVREAALNADMSPGEYMAKINPEFGPSAYDDVLELHKHMHAILLG